jgi:hypothetical protein
MSSPVGETKPWLVCQLSLIIDSPRIKQQRKRNGRKKEKGYMQRLAA